MIFTKFNPTEDKVKALSKKLMEEPLYLSDEYRNWELIHKALFNNFSNENNIFYEIGEWGGLMSFLNILEGWKCSMAFKLWEPELWGTKIIRQGKELIKEIFNKYNLKRMETDSPDEKMVKMAKICGFKTEGKFKYGFSWNKETYTLHKMRILREELGGK